MLLFLTSILFSQNTEFGLTGNIGLSKIQYDLESENSKNDMLALSGSFGLFFEKVIKSKSGVGAKLLWVSIKGRTEVSGIELFTIDPQTLMREVIGTSSTSTNFQSNYIGLPVYYFYDLNKLRINAGIQPMLLLNTNSRFKNIIFFEGEANETEGENQNFQFERIDLGITLGFSYDLTQKLYMSSNFYYGLLNIDKLSSISERKNRQFTVGLNYSLL